MINKIDLKHQRADEVAEEMEQTLGIDIENIVRVSAKTGIGIDELLEGDYRIVPPPRAIPRRHCRPWFSIRTTTNFAARLLMCES